MECMNLSQLSGKEDCAGSVGRRARDCLGESSSRWAAQELGMKVKYKCAAFGTNVNGHSAPKTGQLSECVAAAIVTTGLDVDGAAFTSPCAAAQPSKWWCTNLGVLGAFLHLNWPELLRPCNLAHLSFSG